MTREHEHQEAADNTAAGGPEAEPHATRGGQLAAFGLDTLGTEAGPPAAGSLDQDDVVDHEAVVRAPRPAGPAVTREAGDRWLSKRTLDRLADAIPANTRRAYTRHAAEFAAWCRAQRRQALPAADETLAEYVSDLIERGLAPASIRQAMAAIRSIHRLAGYPHRPGTALAHTLIRAHARTRAAAGIRPKQAAPVDVDVLRRLVTACPAGTNAGRRDRALIVLGMPMMARRSELAALNTTDIDFTDDGLVVHLAMSKTDQDAAGATVAIPAGTHRDTDPVRVLRAWLDLLPDRGPLFRPVTRWDHIAAARMSGAAITNAITRTAIRAGLEAGGTYTAHGLRAGGATAAYKAGANPADIARHGRWSATSPVFWTYIRTVDQWKDNPVRGMGL